MWQNGSLLNARIYSDAPASFFFLSFAWKSSFCEINFGGGTTGMRTPIVGGGKMLTL